MVEHQNDVSKVEWPDSHEGPTDCGEIFDYVVRKGPLYDDTVWNNCPFMGVDGVIECLDYLQDNGYISQADSGMFYVPMRDN